MPTHTPAHSRRGLRFSTAIISCALLLGGCHSAAQSPSPTTTAAAATHTTTTESSSAQAAAEILAHALDTSPLPTKANATTLAPTASTVTIDEGGAYLLAGDYPGGINITTDQPVTLLLEGASIGSGESTTAAITSHAKSLTLAATTDSSISSGTQAHAVNADGDVHLRGSATLNITAGKDGIHADGAILLNGPRITITAGDDGLAATATADSDNAGLIGLAAGTLTITSQDDGISADRVAITDAHTTITAGGGAPAGETSSEHTQPDMPPLPGGMPFGAGAEDGSNPPPAGAQPDDPNRPQRPEDAQQPPAAPPQDAPVQGQRQQPPSEAQGTSAGANTNTDAGAGSGTAEEDTPTPHGINADTLISISGGELTINAHTDALTSDGDIRIDNGTLDLQAGDDGVHADNTLTITGGTITVTTAEEGFEANHLTVTGATTAVTTRDDGWNAAGDNNPSLSISGGTHTITARGDGLDSNGDLTIDGGTTIINGPTDQGNGALDADGTFTLNGGTLIALSGGGMLRTPDAGKQSSVTATTTATTPATTHITITGTDGTTLAETTAGVDFTTIQASAPTLTDADTVTISLKGDDLDESINATAGDNPSPHSPGMPPAAPTGRR